MEFTQDDVLCYVKSEDVKFIRLAFCDTEGRQKNLAVMPETLPRAFSQGIPVDGRELPGFGGYPVAAERACTADGVYCSGRDAFCPVQTGRAGPPHN